MNFLINDALRLLNLQGDASALETLGSLQENWAAIQARIPELQSGDHDVIDLLTAFADRIPAARSAIVAAGSDLPTVLDLANGVQQRYENEVPETVRKLLQPHARFAAGEKDSGLLTWNILDARGSTSRTLAKTKVALAVSGAAGLSVELEAGDSLPEGGAEDASYFRYGFNGSVRGGAQVDVPFQFGSLGAASAASSEVDLDYWYNVPPPARSQPIALFAAQNITRLANPFELESLWKAMCRRNSRLEAVKLRTTLDHESSIGMRFGAAMALLEEDMLSATFEFKASAVTRRTFETFIYADDDGGDRFLVSRVKSLQGQDHNSSAAFEIGVDMGEVAGQALGFIDPYLNKYSTLRDQFEAYLQPGTLLLGELRDALDTQIEKALDEKPELQRLALSLTGDNDQPQLLQEHLVEKIAEVFGSGLGIFSRPAQDIATEIVDRINQSLPEKYGAPAGSQAREFLVEVIATINSKLESEVRGLVDNGGRKFDQLIKQVDKFHQDIGERINKKGKKLDLALGGVRSFLARVDEKIQKIARALEKATTARLTLRLWDEQTLRRESSVDIVARYLKNDAANRDAFKRITRGDFEEIERLFTQAPPNLAFMDGDVTYTTGRHKSTGVEIGLLDLDLGGRSLFDSSVKITVDIDGNLVINSSLAASRRIQSAREAQQVSFLSPFELNAARHTRNMRAKLVVSQDDKNLKIDELEDFLRAFKKVGLLSTVTVSRAVSQLKLWRQKSDRKHVKARVDISLALDTEAIRSLFENQPGSSDRQIIELISSVLYDARVFRRNKRTIDRAATRLKGLTRDTGDTRDVFLQVQPAIPKKYGESSIRQLFIASKFGTTQDESKFFPIAESSDPRLRQAFAIHMYCKGFAVMLNTMRAVYNINTLNKSGKELVEFLDTQNQLINLCLRRWLKVGQKFLWLPSDEASEETVAFFLALARQAGLDARTDTRDSIMSVTLTLNDRDGGTVMVY